MTDKEKKSEYNRRYYEKNKEKILAERKTQERKPSAPIDKEAHRKAAREWYHRKKASETPEEREARLEKRRAASRAKKGS
ncbi:MAG: hypothetical protein IJ064_05680 [Bacteroidaceae bacterium]|nr:hypothetical protein [Bacteroidaceae bacterium]